MDILKAFSLLIAFYIIMAVQNAEAYEPVPTDEVEQFVDIHRSIPIDLEKFRGYLRPGYEETLLPEAVIVRVVCFSDGSGEMYSVDNKEEAIWNKLTSEGASELNDVAIEIGSSTCEYEWEQYYGPKPLHREGQRSWYL